MKTPQQDIDGVAVVPTSEWVARSGMAAIVARLTPRPPTADPRQLDIFQAEEPQLKLFDGV
jgi:hypothetical protein